MTVLVPAWPAVSVLVLVDEVLVSVEACRMNEVLHCELVVQLPVSLDVEAS